MNSILRLISILSLVCTTLLYASPAYAGEVDYKVSGTVKSDTGEPLIGVFVYVKGTNDGVMTDNSGYYEIAVPEAGKTHFLVFQYIGMEMIEREVDKEERLDVVMKPDNKLEEAVVVGAYGVKQKREDLIGSAFQVNSERLKDKPKARIDDILNGLVPGLMVEPRTDKAGSTRPRLNVRVRGEASLVASNEPLWIIDGVPTYTGDRNNMMPGMSLTVSPLSLIDPNDIESITVLKDADQTTIYGANGANGVILVTTKSGDFGNRPLKVSATLNYGLSVPDRSTMVKMMNASQYMEVAKEAWANGGNRMSDFPFRDNDYNSFSTTSTDWSDVYLGMGSSLYACVSATSGSKKAKNYLSGSFYRNANTVRKDLSRRFYVRMSQSYNPLDNVKAGISLTASYNHNDLFSLGSDYLGTLPIYSPYLEDGHTFRLYNKLWSDTKGTFIMRKFFANKVPDRELNDNIQTSLKTIGNANLEWEVIKGLKLSDVFGIEYQHSHGDAYDSRLTLAGMDENGNGIGHAQREDSFYTMWTNTSKLDFSKAFGRHNVGGFAGLELNSKGYKTSNASGSGFMNDHVKEIYYAAEASRKGGGGSSMSRTMSYFIRGTYSYDKRYYVSCNYRRDGNSSFGKFSRWGNFWSAGVSWNIHNEAFFKSNAINLLKLKATYGTSGNSRIDTSVATGRYSYSESFSYLGSAGARLESVPNPGLSWETTRIINVGLDLSLLKRLDIGVEYYNNLTDNLLSRIYVSRTISDDRIYANVGNIRNTGFEVSIKSANISGKDFEWTTTLNFSHNNNKILKLYEGIPTGFGSKVWMEGYDTDTWYLVRWAGVDPADGSPMWYDKEGNVTKKYSAENRVPDKTSTPFGYGGLMNDFRWKNLSLSFQINYNIGGYALPSYASLYMKDGYDITGGNQAVEVYYYRWKQAGEVARYPRVSQKTTSSTMFSTRYLYKKTYFNLSNLSLSYRLPDKLASKMRLENVLVSLLCDNLYLFTPGQSRTYNSYKTVMNGYPVTRTFTIGINASF